MLGRQKMKKVAELLGIIKEAAMIAVLPDGAVAFKEAKKMHDNAPFGSEDKKQALTRLLSLCTIPGQAKEVYESYRARLPGVYYRAMDTHYRAMGMNRGSGSNKPDEAEQQMLEKWEELSLQQVRAAQTVEQIKAAYDNAPNDSEARRQAIIKASELMAME